MATTLLNWVHCIARANAERQARGVIASCSAAGANRIGKVFCQPGNAPTRIFCAARPDGTATPRVRVQPVSAVRFLRRAWLVPGSPRPIGKDFPRLWHGPCSRMSHKTRSKTAEARKAGGVEPSRTAKESQMAISGNVVMTRWRFFATGWRRWRRVDTCRLPSLRPLIVSV
jgi:hypothetical protein